MGNLTLQSLTQYLAQFCAVTKSRLFIHSPKSKLEVQFLASKFRTNLNGSKAYPIVKSINSAFSWHPPVAAPILPPLESKRVIDQLCERIRYLHDSLRSEQAYCRWVKEYISRLANTRKAAALTRKQALSASLFFYSKVLAFDSPWLKSCAKKKD
jgi:Phage integrase, N-terminal SAM-like domain